MRLIKYFLILGLLAGCAGTGPSTTAITSADDADTAERDVGETYALVQVDRDVAQLVSRFDAHPVSFFGDTKQRAAIIGVGDTLAVSILSVTGEASIGSGVTATAPLNTVAIPPQEVSQSGTITVPPLGRVLANGKTVQQFENFLRRRLAEVLVDPSVVVTLTNRQSARVALIGQVAGAGTRPMNAVDTRLIDIIVSQGGPTGRPEDLVVKLSRNGQTRSVPLDVLFEQPRYNVTVQAGDVIAVEAATIELVVLGATRNSRTRFDESSLTLSEALAQSGGLLDRRSDRKGVFIYRLEDPQIIRSVGLNTVADSATHRVPTIYRFDLTDPSAFFVTSAFQMQDGDILYVSNSLSDRVSAVISALSPFAPSPRAIISSSLE